MCRFVLLVLFGICFLLPGLSLASDQDRDRDHDRIYDQSTDLGRDRLRERKHLSEDDAAIYGSQLMTERERYQYREQLRTMQTPEQQKNFRRQHHEKIQRRAEAKGIKLKNFPPEPMHKGSWGPSQGPVSGKSGSK